MGIGAIAGAALFGRVADAIQSSSLVLGYRGSDIKPEYLVSIKNFFPRDYKNNSNGNSSVTIKAPLVEKFGLKLESQWSAIINGNAITDTAQALSQLAFNRSLASKYMSRRIWTGTTPLDFTLNLQFRAIEDAKLEVVRPCQELQRLILPYSGSGKLDKIFLHPPGPSPYKEAAANFDYFNEGEITYVAIGTLLLMKRVIVKDISIEYLPQFTKDGDPIAANAAVHFQTYEILTKETITDKTDSGGIYNGGREGKSKVNIESRKRDN